jgi:hypothetical protein
MEHHLIGHLPSYLRWQEEDRGVCELCDGEVRHVWTPAWTREVGAWYRDKVVGD